MLDIYEAMPNGDWKFTKTDDKFDTVRVKVDPAAEAVNSLVEKDNRRAEGNAIVDQENYIRRFYHDPSTNSFVSTLPKGMIELSDDIAIGYSKKKGKVVYGDMLVITNQGRVDKGDFDDYVIDMAKHVGQNTDVEHILTTYKDRAQFWNNKDMFSVNAQPMLNVMNAGGPAPKRYVHTHTLGAYSETDPERYNLGSSKTDRNLVRKISQGYQSDGYANTINSVIAPMTRDELIDYNGDGDIGIVDNEQNRATMYENVRKFDSVRNGR